MPVRLSGMISGMDTDTLIKGILDAERLKNKKVSDKQTMLTWKEEKWKELNAKLYKLYSEDLSKLRLQGNYMTKKVTTTNDALVEVKGNNNAATGSHVISDIKLASSQFLTGKELDGNVAVKGTSKLSDLGIDDGTQIKITSKGKEYILDVNEDTTVNNLVQKLKDAGLNASFDEVQKRFFISSKDSGKDNQFTITTFKDDSINDKRAIENAVGYSGLSAANKEKVDSAYKVIKGVDEKLLENIFDSPEISEGDSDETKAIKRAVLTLKDLTKAKVEKDANAKAIADVKAEMKDAIKNGGTYAEVDYNGLLGQIEEIGKGELRKIHNDEDLDFDDPDINAELEQWMDKHIDARVNSSMDTAIVKEKIKNKKDSTINASKDSEGSILNANEKLKENITLYASGAIHETDPNASQPLAGIGLSEVFRDKNGNVQAGDGISLIKAEDSLVNYNGAVISGKTNVISVNGLTITLKGETKIDEKINLSVTNDTEAVYDNIKKFINSYNEILKEMNDLYNADVLKGYAPLSDEEKEMMTDKQIEKWESSIKDSILRRDNTLGSIIDTMRNGLNGTIEIDGKKYSLSSLGITTSSDYKERGLIYIQGDEDSKYYSEKTNKLMEMLESDPEKVAKIFSGITTGLYDSMQDKMKSIPNVRSAFTFYNDKTMKNQIDSYGKEVKKLEKKLVALENKYYKQFAAMETALAKLQSQSNALASMLGLNTNQ